MPRPNRSPTHINLQSKMDEILANNIEFLNKLELQSTVIQDAVKKAIQENDVASGNITMPILTEKLDDHHTSIIEFIKQNFANLSDDCGVDCNNSTKCAPEPSELLFVDELQKGTELNPIYCYSSQFWDVPKDFSFQKNPTRKVGWEFWLKGNLNNEVLIDVCKKRAPLKPFRKFDHRRLPKKERNVFCSSWKPIFKFMQQTPGLQIPNVSTRNNSGVY